MEHLKMRWFSARRGTWPPGGKNKSRWSPDNHITGLVGFSHFIYGLELVGACPSDLIQLPRVRDQGSKVLP